MRARILAALLMVAAVVPAAGPLWLLCGDGTLHKTCCCAGEVEAASEEARFEAPDCCVMTVVETAAPAPTVGSDAFQLAPPARVEQLALAPVPPLLLEEGIERPAVVRARGPPPDGPPLYLENCALLI